MNALFCRKWRIALLLVTSGCAGDLEHAEDYQTVPVRDAVSMPQAGRTSAGAGQGGWGGSKPAANAGGSGGAGGWASQSASGGKGGAVATPQGGAGGAVNNSTNTEEDAGVPESTPTQMAPPQPMACDFRALMQDKCGNATCHGGPGASTGLDLTSAMLGARVEGREGKGACSDKLLVDPDNPRDSKLYLKVSGSTCGSQMPLGGQLNADEQACVLSWIEGL
jgi:hypothetical protein